MHKFNLIYLFAIFSSLFLYSCKDDEVIVLSKFVEWEIDNKNPEAIYVADQAEFFIEIRSSDNRAENEIQLFSKNIKTFYHVQIKAYGENNKDIELVEKKAAMSENFEREWSDSLLYSCEWCEILVRENSVLIRYLPFAGESEIKHIGVYHTDFPLLSVGGTLKFNPFMRLYTSGIEIYPPFAVR
ncbi:MAG: hypothetical protein J1E38_06620 [Paramuribaculum sp.]|nr:hypothetical protein [Paramuribaculum sp.]